MENTKKPLSKCKLVFCGDTRNNVAYCLMYICAKLGIHYVGWGPKELAPAADVVEYCREVGKETGAIVTCDNHNVIGALGTAVAEVTAEECPVPVVRIGVTDHFGEVGKMDFLKAKYHMTAADIAAAARTAIQKKGGR